MRPLTTALATWLEDQPAIRLGEVLIRPAPGGGYTLRHWEDAERADLALHTDPLQARHLALLDDANQYRPLRTAPNLRHGWQMQVADTHALRTALEGFYPAMLGVLYDFRDGQVRPVPLRETLNRQSGMYALTKKLTDDQAQETVGRFCQSQTGCLKTILWPLEAQQPITTLPPEKFDPAPATALGATWPLLCHEACNLLVAEARETVKRARAAAEGSPSAA